MTKCCVQVEVERNKERRNHKIRVFPVNGENRQRYHLPYSHPNLVPPLYQGSVEKIKIKTFVRIRPGHVIITRQWKKKSTLQFGIMAKILRLNIRLNLSNIRRFVSEAANLMNSLKVPAELSMNAIFDFIKVIGLIISSTSKKKIVLAASAHPIFF